MSAKCEKALDILDLLDKHYTALGQTFLHYQKPWQLLIATILSAQCTDERVNTVTKDLFVQYPTLEDFAVADTALLEKAIRSTGFYRNKARHIIETSRIIEKQGGDLPSDINLLTKLPGVGRKTANVIRGHIFGIASIVVDTHVKRVSNRLGLAVSQDPVKIEFELMEILPKENWIRYNTQVITHGRSICTARSPKCGICFLGELCQKNIDYLKQKC